MKTKAIVTGGSGFIGSNLVDKLIEMQWDVVVIDNQSAANDVFYKNDKAAYYGLDVNSYDSIAHLFRGVDYVFHLAAESRIGPCVEDPVLACRTNVIGTCNVLQAARTHGVKKVVYSSTSACYGLANEPPLVETMKNDNLNPYSVSKLAAEDLCIMYNNLFDQKTTALRYFNVFGERMPDRGQYAPVVAIFQRQQRNGNTITIVGDGKQSRDFVYVMDVVDANIKSALSTKADGEVYNVGTGTNVSVLEIAQCFAGNKEHLPPRAGEAQTTLANIDKIQKDLGWKPCVNVIDWIKEQNEKV